MKILVFELACLSGGFEKNVMFEGLEMLKMASGGLFRAGHEVTVPVGAGLEIKPGISSGKIIEIENSGAWSLAGKIGDIVNAGNIDCVFPIAPDSYLVEIVRSLRSRGIEVIAPENNAIEVAADKWKTYRVFKKAGVATPKTGLFKGNAGDYPFIVKPRRGVACENLFKIDNEREFKFLLNELLKRRIKNNDFIIQEFIEGDNVSVTLFSDGKEAVPVSLNGQNLMLSSNGSHYLGGVVPYEHPLKDEAFLAAKHAVESVSGLKGAIGVDLVLSGRPYVIEINPRVTTSMTALEKVCGLNVANSALLAYKGRLHEIPAVDFKEIKNRIEFSHKLVNGESTGIEFS